MNKKVVVAIMAVLLGSSAIYVGFGFSGNSSVPESRQGEFPDPTNGINW